MKLSILACLRAWICMSAQAKKEIHEIAHVIFIDIVGYSKLLIIEARVLSCSSDS